VTHVIPVGTSEPQEFKLKNDGEPIDGTGLTVGIRIYEDGCPDNTVSGLTVEWLDEAAGTVAVTGMETLDVGKYRVRFSLTDGDSLVGYAPNGRVADVWEVVN